MRRLTPTQVSTLADMLTYCRPHGSPSERVFLNRYLAPLPGIVEDTFGNWHVRIGDAPVLWSCHTDTVHHIGGRQTVHIDPQVGYISLSRRSRKRSACLGADDTVGVFLMREMILANVPGLYIFHYGEESGCIGSGDLAEYTPEVLDGIRYAIALDRAGCHDVITSQLGGQCCSPAFADALATSLGPLWAPTHGVFTDTANYTHLVPECTNLSVGYHHAHSAREYVDLHHIGTLLATLCSLGTSTLPCERTPSRSQWLLSSSSYVPAITSGYASHWCDICEAPIVDPVYLWGDGEHRCICDDRDRRGYLDMREVGDNEPMTDDDRRFLAHLRGL